MVSSGLPRIDEQRQVAADPDRVEMIEEEEAVPADKVLDVVLGRDDQDVDAGLVEEIVELRRIERRALRVTDRKSLLALRGVGPGSEAGSVRSHGRRVTSVGLGVKHGRRKAGGCPDQSLFQFGSPKIELLGAKTTKNQTIRKRTEPAFIEPMQCKPSTALPAGEKWTLEIKFDGYRCIAVKREHKVTLFAPREGAQQALSPASSRRLPRSQADFVLDGELVAFDPRGRPLFRALRKAVLSPHLPLYFYAFDLLDQNGGLIVNLPFSRLCASCLERPACRAQRIRCACRHDEKRHQDKFLRRCASSVWNA